MFYPPKGFFFSRPINGIISGIFVSLCSAHISVNKITVTSLQLNLTGDNHCFEINPSLELHCVAKGKASFLKMMQIKFPVVGKRTKTFYGYNVFRKTWKRAKSNIFSLFWTDITTHLQFKFFTGIKNLFIFSQLTVRFMV